MKTLEYYQLRAGGLGIIAGLAALWGAVVGGAVGLAQHQWGPVLLFAGWAAAVAVVYGTPIGRWVARSVNGFVPEMLFLVLLVAPYFVLVWPPRKLAVSRGWIVELDVEPGV
ncbi:hypothetical protein [Anaeromyxobacter sp. PSR-1]|uniref:hypothetical protein n=1 Tax=unclassified Anaeromyxobacter TaxID=2620896 RepID=UPI0005E6E583|nr:hypothetical protein [Anaeromyxobacter sp. PSR-1]GAO01759.1 hypothetical protein PSR1_00619 [Anaeromyxobacter sp. PSR-1]